MMFSLGLVLIIYPEWLNHAGIAVLMLVTAIFASVLIMQIDQRIHGAARKR